MVNIEDGKWNGKRKSQREQRCLDEDCKKWKIVNKKKRENDCLAFYSNILLRCIKDNKDKRIVSRKKMVMVVIIGN